MPKTHSKLHAGRNILSGISTCFSSIFKSSASSVALSAKTTARSAEETLSSRSLELVTYESTVTHVEEISQTLPSVLPEYSPEPLPLSSAGSLLEHTSETKPHPKPHPRPQSLPKHISSVIFQALQTDLALYESYINTESGSNDPLIYYLKASRLYELALLSDNCTYTYKDAMASLEKAIALSESKEVIFLDAANVIQHSMYQYDLDYNDKMMSSIKEIYKLHIIHPPRNYIDQEIHSCVISRFAPKIRHIFNQTTKPSVDNNSSGVEISALELDLKLHNEIILSNKGCNDPLIYYSKARILHDLSHLTHGRLYHDKIYLPLASMSSLENAINLSSNLSANPSTNLSKGQKIVFLATGACTYFSVGRYVDAVKYMYQICKLTHEEISCENLEDLNIAKGMIRDLAIQPQVKKAYMDSDEWSIKGRSSFDTKESCKAEMRDFMTRCGMKHDSIYYDFEDSSDDKLISIKHTGEIPSDIKDIIEALGESEDDMI